MVDTELVRMRLVAQRLVGQKNADAHAAAAFLGAAQGQDLPGVIASITLRLDPPSASQVLAAFDAGTIVRAYPMRGTVFVLAAEDARWMTELCAPGPLRAQIGRRGRLGLDQAQVDAARTVLEEAAGDEGIGRKDLFSAWARRGISPDGGRGYHLLSHLVQSGVAVFGRWDGTDNAVHVADTWLPSGTSLDERFDGDRVAATAALLKRYLSSHGPATLREFAWWSKLPLTGIREALGLVEGELESCGEDRWSRPGLRDELAAAGRGSEALLLLPGFDELVLGYPDRTVLIPKEHHPRLVPGNNGVFRRSVVRRGRAVGLWKRAGTAAGRRLEIEEFAPLPRVAQREAARAFREFPFLVP
jgi:hypothetical protein